MDRRPNLFSYATKELSQDAVICWLIAWAGVKQCSASEDEALRRCGRTFVDALFAKWEGYPVELGDEISVEIHRQEKHIDVLARIDNHHVLLIEDKTGTGAHGNQLEDYWNAVVDGKTAFGEVNKDDLYPIYLKTGNQSIIEADRIGENDEYAVFNRADFLGKLCSSPFPSRRGGSEPTAGDRRPTKRAEALPFVPESGPGTPDSCSFRPVFRRSAENGRNGRAFQPVA